MTEVQRHEGRGEAVPDKLSIHVRLWYNCYTQAARILGIRMQRNPNKAINHMSCLTRLKPSLRADVEYSKEVSITSIGYWDLLRTVEGTYRN